MTLWMGAHPWASFAIGAVVGSTATLVAIVAWLVSFGDWED